jgi:hypothetical protein
MQYNNLRIQFTFLCYFGDSSGSNVQLGDTFGESGNIPFLITQSLQLACL